MIVASISIFSILFLAYLAIRNNEPRTKDRSTLEVWWWISQKWEMSIPGRELSGYVNKVELKNGRMILYAHFPVHIPSPAGAIGKVVLRGSDGVVVYETSSERQFKQLRVGDTLDFWLEMEIVKKVKDGGCDE